MSPHPRARGPSKPSLVVGIDHNAPGRPPRAGRIKGAGVVVHPMDRDDDLQGRFICHAGRTPERETQPCAVETLEPVGVEARRWSAGRSQRPLPDRSASGDQNRNTDHNEPNEPWSRHPCRSPLTPNRFIMSCAGRMRPEADAHPETKSLAAGTRPGSLPSVSQTGETS